MATCACCHRSLKNPDSVERGIGPVCSAKLQGEKADGQAQLLPPSYSGPVTLADIPKAVRKIYRGSRDALGIEILVELPSGDEYHLKHTIHHSPTGLEWG